jgi:disulfide bond formation protein DsbB
MLKNLTSHQTALAIALVLFVVIAGAWIFEYAGYLPCELCLKQRWAYYVGVPFALILGLARPTWVKPGLYALSLLLAANAMFGIYHSGVEWKFWAGPSTCTGGALSADGLPDLGKPAVMCDQPAIRILGLSLAGWNAIICAALATIAFRVARKDQGQN